jgi:hypothetical protein
MNKTSDLKFLLSPPRVKKRKNKIQSLGFSVRKCRLYLKTVEIPSPTATGGGKDIIS